MPEDLMRVAVDRSVCTGHGRCYSLAPAVYEPDDDGYCVVAASPVPPELHERAVLGARNCPEDAISVVDAES